MFSNTDHYDSVIGMVTDDRLNTQSSNFTAGVRLYGTYTLLDNSLKFFVGGGIDALIEDDGTIALPVIEAGVSFKPFTLIRPKTAPLNAPYEHHWQMKMNFLPPEEVRMANAVYFEADSVVFIERYRQVLDEAGERLAEFPDTTITLRAYSAPFGTMDGQITISAARAWFCVEYFVRRYGIDEERMNIEFYGAEKLPDLIDATWDSYRCVEFLIN